jgi:integrase
MAKLTAKSVENLKPRDKRVEIPDAGSGLYLISQSSGHRSWAVRYRVNGKPSKYTIGAWPAVSLHDARVAAAEALKQVRLGNDPAKARQDSKIKADAAKADTFTAIAENYLKRPETRKLRTLAARVSILKRQVYPVLGSRPIGEIRRREIADLLDKIEDKSGPRAADVCLAILRKILRWHATRDDEFVTPVVPGMNRQIAAEHRRKRTLTDAEICAVWQATEDNTTFSALVRFALLTSARRNEIAGMKWDEIDANGIWTLPASRSKTKAEVVRPLSKAALALIEQMPQIDGCPYVFTSTARTPIRQFSSPKQRLDVASGVVGWRLHDLRRTARSLLSRCKGVTVDHAERVLGHAIPGMRAVYDKHDYAEEIRFAVEALAALVKTIINPPEGEVADLATARARRRR